MPMASNSGESPTVLILVDIQQGFNDPVYWGPERSNPKFEENAAALLNSYRALTARSPRHLLIHINHASRLLDCPLHPSLPGFAFQGFAEPAAGELVITKKVNSSFIGTELEQVVRKHLKGGGGGSGTVYIAGLTTDHCVSTTTRMAGNLGVAGPDGEVVFIEDATAAWKKDVASRWDAETVHAVNVESLKEFATIRKTQEVVDEWSTF